MSNTSSATEGQNVNSGPAFGFQSAASNSHSVTGFGEASFGSSPAVCSGFVASSNIRPPAGFDFGFGSKYTTSSTTSWNFRAAALSSGIDYASATAVCNNAVSTSMTAFGTGGTQFV